MVKRYYEGELDEQVIEQADTQIIAQTLEFAAGNIGVWNNIDFELRQEYTILEGNINESGSFDELGVKYDWNVNAAAELITFLELGQPGLAEFDYPINLNVELPTLVNSNETFSIKTLPNYRVEMASIEGKGFSLPRAGIDLVYNVGGSGLDNLSIEFPFSSPFELGNIRKFRGFSGKRNLIRAEVGNTRLNFPLVDGVLLGNMILPDGITAPPIPTTGLPGELPQVKGTGRDNIAQLLLDLDAIAALIFPQLRLVGNQIKFPKMGRNNVRLRYDLLDVKANLGLALQQDFIFDADKVSVTLSVDGQPEQTGFIGDSFSFTAPEQESEVIEVTATYELLGDVSTEISLVPQGFIQFDALKYLIDLNFGIIQNRIAGGPLFSRRFPEGGLPISESIPLFTSDPIDIAEIGANVINVFETTYRIPYNKNQGDGPIDGGTGNDTLTGRSGRDILQGDAGRDVLMFSSSTAVPNRVGADTMEIFEVGSDTIGLTTGSISDDFILEPRGTNSIIKTAESDAILAMVSQVMPSELEGSLVPVNINLF